jgi:hypothetical protein
MYTCYEHGDKVFEQGAWPAYGSTGIEMFSLGIVDAASSTSLATKSL